MTPSGEATAVPTVNSKRIYKDVFDLESFESVRLAKDVVLDPPVTSIEEALGRVGNDAAKLLKILNDGLIQETITAAEETPGFLVFDEENKTLGGEFTGQSANEDAVKTLVLSIAKGVFGYEKSKPVEAKRAAKESAMNLIKSNEQMRAGLKANAKA